MTAETWAIPICGSIVAQELISRVLAARTPTIARRSSVIAGITYLLVGLIPVTIGLLAIKALPSLEHAEQVLPMMARQHLSTFLYVIFAGALVSAILSTVDSSLLAASGLLVHNLILPVMPASTERRKVMFQRAGVLTMGVLSYVLALYAEGVYDLVKDASSFGSAGIFVVFLVGIFSTFGSTRAAAASLIAGAVIWIVSHYIFDFSYGYLLSLAVAATLYVAGGLMERGKVRF